MYRSKHFKKNTYGRNIVVVAVLILTFTIAIGSTVAYLIASTPSVINVFTPSQVTTAVVEQTVGDMTTGVKIANTNNTQAYIRAAVVVTWQDEDGNVYGKAPAEGTDYSMAWIGINDGSWVKGSDGYYYHKAPVDPEGSAIDTTSILFKDFKALTNAPAEGFSINVEVIGSGIQSTPTSVVSEEWGVTLASDGMIIGK